MLYPRSNPFRQTVDLSGFWEFRFDPDRIGDAQEWRHGFDNSRPIAVPASWNDQFENGRDYLDAAWYQTRFDRPWGWDAAGQCVKVRFNSVNYLAEVWLNGVRLGAHEGGHLPFEFDITPYLRREGNILVARVEGELAPDRVPPGVTQEDPGQFFPVLWERYPFAFFDFFPFCGIQRPVLLHSTAADGISDITVVTEIAGREGRVHVQFQRAAENTVTARFTLRGHGANIVNETSANEVTLTVPDAALWAPGAPHLYDLTVELTRGGVVFDRYTLPIGIRTVKVEGDTLLLNGKPIYLQGFDRHEDFPIMGRGLAPAVIIKDYALLDWIGANSFRTSHYPYAEQQMDLADRLGILVIDETPAVGLFFAEEGLARRLELCRQYTRELIARDKNHPSVIMWSLANEPHSEDPGAKAFFRDLYDLAKSLDSTRPTTLVSCKGTREESFEFLDVLCLNRYYGWYHQSGQLDAACVQLSKELDAMHAKFRKPLILAEFGVDTIPGCHALPPEMFSEEFQAEMLTRYIAVLRSKPFVIGEHVWNMCDFKTGQDVRRMGGMNHKGVFTRDRRPKLAAHRLRELWRCQKPGL
jgi:beta-glucuronidase